MLGCTSSSTSMSNARSSAPANSSASSSAPTKKPSRFGKLKFLSPTSEQQPRNQSDSASLPSAAQPVQPVVENTEERREMIEKAASERDEKRKKKVTEALESAQRRLDVAFSVIQAEMDDNIATSKWSTWEKKSALLLLVMLTFTHQYWVVSYLTCFALMFYSYWHSASRHLEAKQAGDNVGARLVDLEDGLRRCELAVQHDVEQEEEWTQMLLEETRQWEERQRELVARRGRGFPYTKRINTQRIRMVTQFHETADRAVQVMHKIEDVARKTLMPHAARESNGEESTVVSNNDMDSGASSAWKAYVNANLPLERLAEESPEEQVFSSQLRINSNGDWDLLPKDIQLMLLRGYADKKDRMKESLDAVRYIIHWRNHTKCDTILQTATAQHESFFKAWGTVYAGEDKYGHIIIADRVETIDLPALFLLEDDFILETRTKQMEVLRRLKLNIERRRGHRVCKHVYILDLAGLNIRKHFTGRVKNLLQSIFKVGGDAYPDSMWQMWLINTPFVFQLVWKALSPTIEASTKAKIRMLGGKEKYLPEMQKCGIPLESIPIEFGGEFPSVNFFQGLQEIIKEDQKETTL